MIEDTVIGNQIGISVLVVHALELLKKTSWFPWIHDNSDRINRVVAIIVAFLTSVGFQFALKGDWQSGGTLIITIPSLGAVLSTIVHASMQAGVQEAYYKSVVKK